MARNKQTARKSTGGRTPRDHLTAERAPGEEMAAFSPEKKRKAPADSTLAETPKRARKTSKPFDNATSSFSHEPSSVATDRTYLTANGSSDIDETAFVTPKTPGPRRGDIAGGSSKASTKASTTMKSPRPTSPHRPLSDRDSDRPHTALGQQSRKEAKKARRAAQRNATGGLEEGKRRQSPVEAKSQDANKSKDLTTQKSALEAHPIAHGEVTSGSWLLSSPSAGSLLHLDPLFVQDEDGQECLLVATAREVLLLLLDTSTITATLPAPPGLQVQAFAASSVHAGEVHILYTNGAIYSWDLKSKPRIRHQCPTSNRIVNAIAVGRILEALDDTIFTLAESSKNSGIYIDDVCIFPTKASLTGLRVSARCEYVIAFGRSTLVLGSKKSTEHAANSAVTEYSWVEIPVGKPLISLDIRQIPPSRKGGKASLSLVIGNDEGQLHLYEDVSSLFSKHAQHDLPIPRILHWHRDAVHTVKFSTDGNYLVSGGSETVLVLWQLSTGNRQYLPHLTSAIEHIVVNPAGDRYAVLMGDNSVMIISTSELKPVANLAGLQSAGSAFISTPVPAVLNPRDENELLLVVPSTQPNHLLKTDALSRPFLQTFNVRNMRHVARQALTRNNATDFNLGPDNTPIEVPDVAHLQISNDGQWLATIDEWAPPASDLQPLTPQNGAILASERQTRLETYLKLWRWDPEQGLWTLTTRFDAPHASSKGFWNAASPICMVSDPSAVGFASLGQDDRVRIWRPKSRLRHGVVMRNSTDTELIEWHCNSVIELPLAAKRADTPNEADEDDDDDSTDACLAWSEDGSMLVAAQSSDDPESAPILHFIDALTGSLISKAVVAPEGLKSLAFLDRYLVALGSGYVNLWDIVEDKLSYRIKISPAREAQPLLAINRINGTFVVATDDKLVVYKTEQSKSEAEFELDTNVASILPNARGYLVLTTDGCVRSLESNGSTRPRDLLLNGSTEVDAEDVVSMDVDTAPSASFADLVQGSIVDPDQDDLDLDDRPVVRPEQLAEIFDTSQSFAMLSVRDMFHAVADLYGKKPIARAPAELE